MCHLPKIIQWATLTLNQRKTPRGVNYFCQYWFKKWLGAVQAPSHFLNQCWPIIDYHLINKCRSNSFQNSNISIEINRFEIVRLRWTPKADGRLMVKTLPMVKQSCGQIICGRMVVNIVPVDVLLTNVDRESAGMIWTKGYSITCKIT